MARWGMYLKRILRPVVTGLMKNDRFSLYFFFSAVKAELWYGADAKSYIKKTVGVQALFDVLRNITQQRQDWKAGTGAFFLAQMKKCAVVDFADPFFQASGTGRSRIRNCLELCLDLRRLNSIQSEHNAYKRLCKLE